MGSRLKLVVAYDGAQFSGWQSQPNGNAIQDYLENAFESICSERVRVHGAGRTDAGVHALAQCAHVDVPKSRYSADRWRAALNGLLPQTIRIMQCRFAPNSFHARFSAKGKVYRYRIWNSEVLPPLEYGRAWHVREPLDCTGISALANSFTGLHDFASFSANRGTAVADTKRSVRSVLFRHSGGLLTLEFEADGFLYKMARLMVGALVQVGSRKVSADEIRARLRDPQPEFTTGRNVAPACGLFLIRVRY